MRFYFELLMFGLLGLALGFWLVSKMPPLNVPGAGLVMFVIMAGLPTTLMGAGVGLRLAIGYDKRRVD